MGARAAAVQIAEHEGKPSIGQGWPEGREKNTGHCTNFTHAAMRGFCWFRIRVEDTASSISAGYIPKYEQIKTSRTTAFFRFSFSPMASWYSGTARSPTTMGNVVAGTAQFTASSPSPPATPGVAAPCVMACFTAALSGTNGSCGSSDWTIF